MPYWTYWEITLLIGEWQSVHSVGVRFWPLVTAVLAALCGGFCGNWSRQVAELPRGVGWTPALVPADASASVQTGYLTEDCREGSNVVNRSQRFII